MRRHPSAFIRLVVGMLSLGLFGPGLAVADVERTPLPTASYAWASQIIDPVVGHVLVSASRRHTTESRVCISASLSYDDVDEHGTTVPTQSYESGCQPSDTYVANVATGTASVSDWIDTTLTVARRLNDTWQTTTTASRVRVQVSWQHDGDAPYAGAELLCYWLFLVCPPPWSAWFEWPTTETGSLIFKSRGRAVSIPERWTGGVAWRS